MGAGTDLVPKTLSPCAPQADFSAESGLFSGKLAFRHRLSVRLLAPAADEPYANLGAGSLKVIDAGDGYVGFQNGIYWDAASNHSRSAIRVLSSPDGERWRVRGPDPIIRPGRGWKRSHVYAMDVRRVGETWLMYFNARDGWFVGRERIGRAVGTRAG